MIAGHRMTDEQVARFANTILAQEANLSEEDWRVVRDCEVLLGEASSTDDLAVVHARVRAAFAARHAEADLDGALHAAGVCCGEGSVLGRACRREGCGGRIHVQPFHRGQLRVCERCEADRGYWHPRGSYLTDRMVGGFGVEGSGIFGEVGGAAEILELLARASSSGRASDGAAADVAAWLSAHAGDPGAHAVREFLCACEHRRTVAQASSGEEVRVGDRVRWDPDIFRRVHGEVTQIRDGQVRMVRVLDAAGPWNPAPLHGEQVALEFAVGDGRLRGTLRRIPRLATMALAAPVPSAPEMGTIGEPSDREVDSVTYTDQVCFVRTIRRWLDEDPSKARWTLTRSQLQGLLSVIDAVIDDSSED